jgi:hypothetical protein
MYPFMRIGRVSVTFFCFCYNYVVDNTTISLIEKETYDILDAYDNLLVLMRPIPLSYVGDLLQQPTTTTRNAHQKYL